MRTSYTPAHIDNAKSLTSSMMGIQNRPPAGTAGSSGRASPLLGDREPLLGQPSTREPTESGEQFPVEHRRKSSGRFGLPIIIFCRLFNTIFAICTVDKANKEVAAGWNVRIHKLLFDFCWIILVWSIFALAASIVSCVFFPSPRRRAGEEAKRGFRDKVRAQFAINDAVLALITLVLLVIACHAMTPRWQGQFVGLMPPVVAMVSSLV